jgi:hypothetical protein
MTSVIHGLTGYRSDLAHSLDHRKEKIVMSEWTYRKASVAAIIASTLLAACSSPAEETEPSAAAPATETSEGQQPAAAEAAPNEDAADAPAAPAPVLPAKLQMLLTDAPGDFEAVPVTIDSVEAYLVTPEPVAAAMGGAGGAGGAPAMDAESGGAGGAESAVVDEVAAEGMWLTIVDEPATYDLLELQNGVTAALGAAEIPAGQYTQIRLIVSSAAVVVDGETHELSIPSGGQTGLKLNYDFDLSGGGDYAIVLDFDAHQSVKKAGKQYLLTPVITVQSFDAQP